MTDKVIDASAAAAMVFIEQTATIVAARVRGHSWVAPSLLKFEMANVCVKKLRAHPAARDTLLSQHDAWQAIPVRFEDVDISAAVSLANRFRLSGYDACYLWLAQELGCELITLDGKLETAAKLLSP